MLKKFRYLDYYLLVPYLVLCAIGIVMDYSASASWIQNQYGQASNSVMLKQLLFVVIGLVVALFFFYFKLSNFRNHKLIGFVWLALLGLLVYLFLIGRLDPSSVVNGASAWIPIGPFNLQPTEFAKLVVIIYLAHIFTQRQDAMRQPDFHVRDLYAPILLVGICLILVFFQPDTGGFLIIAAIMVVMLAASGISLRYGFSWMALVGALVAAVYWVLDNVNLPKSIITNYRVRRIVSSLHPFQTRTNDGNQVFNSLVAIDHGGLFGVGLGMSSQKLGYLSQPYTDFILAVIAEELGAIGAILVIALIFFLILRCYLIGVRSRNPYHSLLAYGIATMMLIQTFFNVGAVLGLIPVTGVTLPFISYGGSSMIVLAISMGIMLNISASEKRVSEKKVAAQTAK
ncbi:FtsW/RodA/SpoVE family cell cycle protein [Lacticaseibacillus mingshuiensis]|uniref:Probable peptidoglycan glycosyltransferase FtsW n=1 Tax=Lacticaseibacillus mingshuiensis TaxID=2799574 RepID=A0ABW4CMC4_9LACO|nr:FtsW/RodA/SpoVE family cell cycle protein [Lacticaseibacillus mingshuiensis]